MASEFRERTRTKLQYAKLHLDEILSRNGPYQADAFARAHEESVLFHVVGAKDSFLQEINDAYGRPLDPDRVKEKSLEKELKKKGFQCQALSRVLELERDKTSWLAQTIRLRHQGTHRFHISHGFHEGDEFDGQVFFRDPRTKEEIQVPIESFLEDCVEKMTQLTEDLRHTLEVETQSQSRPIIKL